MTPQQPGRGALVTGATRGIGRAIALRLAAGGYGLCLLGRDAQALEEVVSACKDKGVECVGHTGDLADPAWPSAAAAAATAALGNIDVLINNAGAADRAAVQDADMGRWRQVLELNFVSIMALCQAVVPQMIERSSGTIINISSISGRNTNAGGGIYCASKHALNGFSGCLFEDVREHGIKVSTIMPGFVDTALTASLGKEAARMIQPDDVADAVEFVLAASTTCCPTEVVIRPQRQP